MKLEPLSGSGPTRNLRNKAHNNSCRRSTHSGRRRRRAIRGSTCDGPCLRTVTRLSASVGQYQRQLEKVLREPDYRRSATTIPCPQGNSKSLELCARKKVEVWVTRPADRGRCARRQRRARGKNARDAR